MVKKAKGRQSGTTVDPLARPSTGYGGAGAWGMEESQAQVLSATEGTGMEMVVKGKIINS